MAILKRIQEKDVNDLTDEEVEVEFMRTIWDIEAHEV